MKHPEDRLAVIKKIRSYTYATAKMVDLQAVALFEESVQDRLILGRRALLGLGQ